MDTILRAIAIYLALLLVFRISGKRTLANSTPFDLVLLLIISETTQEAMVGDDHSLTQAAVLIATLVACAIGLSLAKQRWPWADRLLEGRPLVLFARGVPHRERMAKARVDEDDILEAARRHHGLRRLEDVDYAVLERDGNVTVVPRDR